MSTGQPLGEVVVNSTTYSFLQACVICGVAADLMDSLVAFGVIVPGGECPPSWRFDELAIHRAKKALRLHRDLGLELQGLALTLELLDEIDRLRAQVARLRVHEPAR